jgi:hypothetical protein
MARMNWRHLGVRSRMRRYGAADVDDLGPLYNPKPRYSPITRSNPRVWHRPAGRENSPPERSFADLDPRNPRDQLSGVDLSVLLGLSECQPPV